MKIALLINGIQEPREETFKAEMKSELVIGLYIIIYDLIYYPFFRSNIKEGFLAGWNDLD